MKVVWRIYKLPRTEKSVGDKYTDVGAKTNVTWHNPVKHCLGRASYRGVSTILRKPGRHSSTAYSPTEDVSESAEI